MKRLIVTLLLLFAGAVVALPGAVGVVTERQHEQLARQINANGNQLTKEHYDRGWFSTTTRYRYRIEDERLKKFIATVTGKAIGTQELLVSSKIFHGPVPAVSGGTGRDILGWTEVDSTLSLLSSSGVETALPGELKSRIEPDGGSRFRYRTKAGTSAIRDGLNMSWNDTDIDIALGRNNQTLSVNGNIGLLKLVDASAVAQLGPMTFTATQKKSRSGLWTGDSELRIAEVSLPGSSGDQLLLETNVLQVGNELTYAVKLKADNLRGEGFSGRELRIDFSGQRLDEKAMGSFFQLLRVYPDPAQIPVSQRDALLTRILATGPELTVRELKIPMSEADIEGDGFVSITPGTGTSLSELSRGAQGNTTLLLPRKLVNHFKAQSSPDMQTAIDMMMRLRVLKPQGNRYKVEAAYANKLLTVNGFPVPIPNF